MLCGSPRGVSIVTRGTDGSTDLRWAAAGLRVARTLE